jgi:hypothetical protein
VAYSIKKRRHAIRAPLIRPVQVNLGDKQVMGQGIEVGTSGMSLWMNEVPEKGKMVTLSFFLPSNSRHILAMSEVSWRQPPIPDVRAGKVGVRFVALPREEREEIRSFINRIAKLYRDLNILLAKDDWKMEQVRAITEAAFVGSYRDIKDLKDKVRRAMDGLRL